jgi:hypothetical protein
MIDQRRHEHGNVLFLILIAVALFAGLSYVVTNSTRSGSGSISNETAKLDQAQSENCDVNIKVAETRLVASGRCTEAELNYVLPTGLNDNPNAPADGSCNIFGPKAGGAILCGVYAKNWEILNPDPEFNDAMTWNTWAQGTGWTVVGGNLIGNNTTGQALTAPPFPLNPSKTYRVEIKILAISSGASLNIAYHNPGAPSHRLVPTITAPGTYVNTEWVPTTSSEWLRVTPDTPGHNYVVDYIRIIEIAP